MSTPPLSSGGIPVGLPPGAGPVNLVQGPIFIGFVFKVLLQGMILVQGYLYFSRYPKDRLLIKAVVGVLIFADQVNIILNAAFLFDAFVIHFGDSLYLSKINWLFATDPMINGFTACTAQIFFAWRIKVLTNNIWITTLVCLFAVISCCGAWGCGIGSVMVGTFEDFPKLTALLILWLAGSVAADVLIAVSLSWHLRRHKTGFAPTDRIIDRIILITLPTGILQAVVAIAALVLAFSIPPPRRGSGIQFIFNYILSKLFTNSLLSGLNSREGWRYDRTSAGDRDHSSGNPTSPLPHSLAPAREEHVELQGPRIIDIPKIRNLDHKTKHSWDIVV